MKHQFADIEARVGKEEKEEEMEQLSDDQVEPIRRERTKSKVLVQKRSSDKMKSVIDKYDKPSKKSKVEEEVEEEDDDTISIQSDVDGPIEILCCVNLIIRYADETSISYFDHIITRQNLTFKEWESVFTQHIKSLPEFKSKNISRISIKEFKTHIQSLNE